MGTLSHQVIVLETNVAPLGGIRDRAGACNVSLHVTIKTPASRIRGDINIVLCEYGRKREGEVKCFGT